MGPFDSDIKTRDFSLREPPQTSRDLWRWYLLFAGAFLFYSFSVLARVGQPVAEEELYWLTPARTFYHQGRPLNYVFPDRTSSFNSPPLYIEILKLAFKFAGDSVMVARLPGMLSGWIAMILTFVIVKNLIRTCEGVKWGVLAATLYGTTPALIQAAAIVDIDPTLLIPASLVLLGCFLKYQEEPALGWAIAMTAATTVCLLCRITTPSILIFLLCLWALVLKKPARQKVIFLLSLVLGILLFLLIWFSYSKYFNFNFSDPFTYTFSVFRYRTKVAGGFTGSQFFENVIYLLFWMGPFACLGFGTLVAQRGIRFVSHRQVFPWDLFLLAGVVLIGGYTLVGGATFGFPRQHCSGMPMAFVFSSLALYQYHPFIFDKVVARHLLGIGLVVVLIQIGITGDLLYFLRYGMRELAILNPSWFPALLLNKAVIEVLWRVATASFLFLLLALTSLKIRWIKNVPLLILLFSLGSNIGVSYLQNIGGYATGLNYGIRGTREAAERIRPFVTAESQVIAPSEVMFYLDWETPHLSHLLNSQWNDVRELRGFLENPATAAFAYSLSANTVAQIRNIVHDRPLQKLLKRNFNDYTVGSFKVYIRKS